MTWKMTRFVVMIVSVAAIALSLGCGLMEISPTPAARIRTVTLPSATFVPATPTMSVSPGPPTNPCPVRQTLASPPRPALFQDYAGTMRTYLAQGGNPAELVTILVNWQARPPSGEVLLQADLTGDAVPETIVAYVNPDTDYLQAESELAIYTCRDQTVETLYIYQPGEWFHLVLIGAQDMTADGVADLIFADETCGAHTCWNSPHVWHWAMTDFVDKVGADFSAPYATFMLEDNRLVIASQGIASVGAGPQRPITNTLSWNGSVVTVTATGVGPSLFRYHVFRDADEAFFARDDVLARFLYQQTLSDDGLLAWAAYTSEEEERRWFDSLAYWRLLLLAVRANDDVQAREYYDTLVTQFAPGKAGYATSAMAQSFWQSYDQSRDITYGCRAALTVPEAQVVADFLNTFGYANPVYAIEDLCP
ncbi:MAG: hypothetical protein JXA21_07240 [Anaerolineae bacterium]|nr:hypothetical protein [Anaerolineae bacterium]